MTPKTTPPRVQVCVPHGPRGRGPLHRSLREASREAAVSVYSDEHVPGTREWIRTGDPQHLSRPYRARLTIAATRIATEMLRLVEEGALDEAEPFELVRRQA